MAVARVNFCINALLAKVCCLEAKFREGIPALRSVLHFFGRSILTKIDSFVLDDRLECWKIISYKGGHCLVQLVP